MALEFIIDRIAAAFFLAKAKKSKEADMLFLCLLFFSSSILGQHLRYDSITLNNTLNPYREHLNKKENIISPNELINMLSEYTSPTIINGTNQSDIAIAMPEKYLHLNPPKYKYEDMARLDSSNALFIETEFPLENRPMLNYVKESYMTEKNKEKKAEFLMGYIFFLSSSGLRYHSYEFSVSRTLQKYVYLFENITRPMPQDTTKANVLIEFGMLLSGINKPYWRNYALSLFLTAAEIYRLPLTNQLHSKKIPDKDQRKYYQDFILSSPNAIRLANTYALIYELLKPLSWSDKSNTLYPLDRQRTSYLYHAYDIISILDSSKHEHQTTLWNYERQFLLEATNKIFTRNNRYSTSLASGYINLLNSHVSKILRSDKPLNNLQLHMLYRALGDIFYILKENIYALKSYMKSLKYILPEPATYASFASEEVFVIIFQCIKMLQESGSSLPDTEDYIGVYRKYAEKLKTDSFENPTQMASYNSRKITNTALIKWLSGDTLEAKKILFNARESAIIDSIGNNLSIQDIYNVILSNGWLTEKKVCNTLLDKYDSVAYTQRHKEDEPNYDGNPYVEQVFADWTNIQSSVSYRFNMSILEDRVSEKERHIAKLNTTEKELNEKIQTFSNRISIAQDEIEKKREENSQLTLLSDTLAEKNKSLSKDINKLGDTLKTLEKSNKDLGQEIANKRSTISWLIYGIVIALIVGGGIIIYFSRRAIKLRAENKKLEIKRNELIQEVSGLQTQIEANKSRYEAELRYENEKVLREQTLKHEIVEVFKDLDYSFEQLYTKTSLVSGLNKKPVEQFKQKLQRISQFAYTYYKSLKNEQEYNSLDDEITVSREYLDFIQMISNDTIIFKDDRTVHDKMIVLPPHMINNFVKNSAKKGQATEINISDFTDKNDYVLSITDNGIGIGENFSIEALDKDSTGIRGVLAQVRYFNSRENQPFEIYLDDSSFIDRSTVENEQGTTVLIRFKRKVA